MQKMTNRHTRELDIFYNEHRRSCTNCNHIFKRADTVHLGFINKKMPAVLCDECSDMLEETVARYFYEELEYDEPLKDDILWRYMDIAKFISLISRKELYFVSANQFDDIYEGAKGVIDRKDIWDNFYVDFFKKAIKTAPNIDIAKLTDKDIEDESKKLLKQLDETGKETRKTTYISCWHHNEYESEAMWKLYSRDITNALAIKTTANNLYEALYKEPRIEIGKVKYIDFNKQFASVNGAYWYKRKSFEHEKEVRAIYTDCNLNKKGVYFSVDINKLIDEIYISPYSPEWLFEIVSDILKKYSVNKPIYQSKMNRKPFY